MKSPLVEFWKNHKGPGFHPEDETWIEQHRKANKIIDWTGENALTHLWDFGAKSNGTSLHQNLIPVPYCGNLKLSRVFILLLNPGFRPSNYIEDHMDCAYRRLRLDNLAQRLNFFPDFSRDAVRSGGFEYFQPRFQPVVDQLMDKQKIEDSNEAADMVSRSVAIIEACPYHSHRSPGPWVFNLPSAQVAKNYVCDVLAPKANKGEILVVSKWGNKHWKLEKGDNILVPRKAVPSSRFTKDEVGKIASFCR